MKRKKMTEADRERHAQMRRNSEWLRELAEKARADLERRRQGLPRHALSSDLESWQVTLTTGDVVELRAHGCRDAGASYAFFALMEGAPAYEYELLRIPKQAVAELTGGSSATAA